MQLSRKYFLREIQTIYLYEPVFPAGIVNVTFGRKRCIKIETPEDSAEQDDAGVKSYNEKFKHLIYTSTDIIQEITMLDSFHRM